MEGDELRTDLHNALYSYLAEYQQSHEEQFAGPVTADEEPLHQAMDRVERFALDVVTTGQIPESLDAELAEFSPGSTLSAKVGGLLAYNFVQHRLEFAVAEDVIDRLRHTPKRVRAAAIAFILLQRAKPTRTAIKYLQRATTLYLAGYDSEVLVMCGAALEAAVAERISDALLASSGMKPAYRRTGVFSLGQRMTFEEKNPLLTRSLRDQFWKVVNWRNDAIHVQPDIGPSPDTAVLMTANLLAAILPRS